MENAVKGAYLCGKNRTEELNKRIYSRNVSSGPLQMNYDPRAVGTKFVRMPVLDCRMPSNTPCERRPVYNTRFMFAGSSQGLPFNGMQARIDTESELKNIIFPLQNAPQAKFIPSSHSDLYNTQYLTPRSHNNSETNTLLFKQETFSKFNPNHCGVGKEMFNNNTRVQIRNCKPGQKPC